MVDLICNLSIYYQNAQAVKDANLDIEANMITTIIGHSGCGKTIFENVAYGLKIKGIFQTKRGKI